VLTYAVVVPSLGDNLKRLRDARELSQERLADLLGHKRPSTVQSWEKNRRRPRADAIQKLAAVLRCAPSDLLEGVQHDYDVLRGTPRPAAPDPPPPQTPAQAEAAEVARLWPHIPTVVRAQILGLLRTLAPKTSRGRAGTPRPADPQVTPEIPPKRRSRAG
jgi:transcriptional regulator with XRE-family HTH domain